MVACEQSFQHRREVSSLTLLGARPRRGLRYGDALRVAGRTVYSFKHMKFSSDFGLRYIFGMPKKGLVLNKLIFLAIVELALFRLLDRGSGTASIHGGVRRVVPLS